MDLTSVKTMPIPRQDIDTYKLRPRDVLFTAGGDRDLRFRHHRPLHQAAGTDDYRPRTHQRAAHHATGAEHQGRAGLEVAVQFAARAQFQPAMGDEVHDRVAERRPEQRPRGRVRTQRQMAGIRGGPVRRSQGEGIVAAIVRRGQPAMIAGIYRLRFRVANPKNAGVKGAWARIHTNNREAFELVQAIRAANNLPALVPPWEANKPQAAAPVDPWPF